MGSQVSTFISIALAISAFEPIVLAQEVKPNATPTPSSRTLISQRYDTSRLRAESGPDDRGRWRFYKPNDVSEDAMRAEGCVNVGGSGPQWRCPRDTIRVEVYDRRSPDYEYGRERYERERDYGRGIRRLRAESGPDDKGRWRFYRPNDVSEDAMRAEGCSFVGTNGPQWRCPRDTIRVEVDDRRQPDYGYNRERRRLRAESGPDDRGRWRFYRPNNVSEDAMRAEGCSFVGTNGPQWRCPRDTIRVEVENRR